MARVTLYNREGKGVGEIELSPALFDVDSNEGLVHDAVVAQEANVRVAIAHTKDRGEVAGTGKKPWKQKGTGRARHGSRRSPIWVGGGITFGPRSIRNFALKFNKKARRKALAMALTDKVRGGALCAVESLSVEEGKTAALARLLKNLPVAGKKTLILVEAENREVGKAARNIPEVATMPVHSLNLVELLKFPSVLISKQGLDELTAHFKRA
ncbi:50S ribosomal protein L4 [Candidatus Parcubacteria bacterium]|nr:50S ribosomal protein L4 [Candidatus Parcubacteria bacterium]